MPHPNEYLKKQAPTKIVLVDEAQVFTGNFYAYTPVIIADGTTSFAVETSRAGDVTEYNGGSSAFKATAADTSITMPAAVGVTVFGQFSKFTGVAACSVILYLEDQE